MSTEENDVLSDSSVVDLFRECKFVEGVDEPTSPEDLQELLEYEGRFTVGIAVDGKVVVQPVHLPPARVFPRKARIEGFRNQLIDDVHSERGVTIDEMCYDNRGGQWSGTLLVTQRAQLIQLLIAARLIDMPAGEIRDKILYLDKWFRLAKQAELMVAA